MQIVSFNRVKTRKEKNYVYKFKNIYINLYVYYFYSLFLPVGLSYCLVLFFLSTVAPLPPSYLVLLIIVILYSACLYVV